MNINSINIKGKYFLLSLTVCSFISLIIITASGLNLISLLFLDIALKWKSLIIIPLTFLLIIWLLKKISLLDNVSIILLPVLLIFLFCTFVGTLLPDTSHDGMAYHSDSIICLVKGKSIITSCPEIDNNSTLNSKNFPAAGWGFASILVSITGLIESSHAHNFIWVVLLILLSIKITIKLKLSLVNSCIFLIIVIFNPVLIYQLWTNYNDGIVYMVSLCNIYSYIFLTDNNKNVKKLGVVLLTSTGVLLLNLKFSSAVLFSLSFLIIFLFALFLVRLNKLKLIKLEKKFISYYFFFIFFIGLANSYHPYLTNLAQGEHIFHSILGKNKSEWTKTINGDCFENEFNIVKAIKSPLANFDLMGGENCKEFIYSRLWSNESTRNIKATFKWFDAHYQKIANHDQGWKIAGFGPTFPFLVLIATIIFVLNLLFREEVCKVKKINLNDNLKFKKLLILFVILVYILVQIFITEPTWIVRYTPLLWTLSLIAVLELSQRKLQLSKVLLLCLFSLLILHVCFLIKTTIPWKKDGYLQARSIEKFTNEFTYNSIYSSRIIFDNFIKFKFDNKSLLSTNNYCFIKKFRYGTTDVLFEIDMRYLELHKNHSDEEKIVQKSLNIFCKKNNNVRNF